MTEKEGSGGKIDALLERIPILDGGGRRRLTAGTIVVLTVLMVFPELRDALKNSVATRDLSLTLIAVSGALLIYAAGFLVELVGEIFLARAVANAVWSFVEAEDHAQRWESKLGPLKWVYIVAWGCLRGVVYFIFGLFGRSRWRMRFRGRLSASARRTYDALPRSVQLALKHSLGAKSEFGRMALVEQLSAPGTRRWARTMMNRPKDVLALVSAVSLSLLIFLVWTPITREASTPTEDALHSLRNDLEKFDEQLNADWEQVDYPRVLSNLPPNDEFRQHLGNAMALHVAIGWLIGGTELDDVVLRRGLGLVERQMKSACEKMSADTSSPTNLTPSFSKLVDTNRSVCKWLRANLGRVSMAIFNESAEIEFQVKSQLLIRCFAGMCALFLYIAFFNALTAVTVSVLEALALEHPDPRPVAPAAALS